MAVNPRRRTSNISLTIKAIQMNPATSPVHSINVEIAKRYGLESSAFLTNLCFWICHNRANNKNYHDGKYWTYNKQDAFVELLPYFNKKQIEYLIKKLETKGLLIKNNFNDTMYDRTCWYTVSDEILALYTGIPVDKKEEPEESVVQEVTEQDINAISENQEVHILNSGNAYPKIRIWKSENQDMHIRKSRNGYPKNRISLTDLNTADKPSLNHTAADIKLLKNCLAHISGDLVFDEQFYLAAAVFLVSHGFPQESFSPYAKWLYDQVILKKPKNVRYYYHKVFILEEYIQLFVSHRRKEAETGIKKRTNLKTCPVCSFAYDNYLNNCPDCQSNYTADETYIRKMKTILDWDEEKRSRYETEMAQICLSGIHQQSNTDLFMKQLDYKFGLVTEDVG